MVVPEQRWIKLILRKADSTRNVLVKQVRQQLRSQRRRNRRSSSLHEVCSGHHLTTAASARSLLLETHQTPARQMALQVHDEDTVLAQLIQPGQRYAVRADTGYNPVIGGVWRIAQKTIPWNDMDARTNDPLQVPAC